MQVLTKEIKLEVTPVYMKIQAAMQSGLYKYIILKGSSRSSKTFSLIDIIDLYSRTKRNKRVTVWRDTKVDAVDTVFSDMKRRLSDTDRWQRGNRFNATKHFLSYKTGSEIQIHGADDLSSVHGLTQDIAWMNEPYKISKAVFDQIDQRTTEFMFIDWNPRLAHWIDDIAKDERAIVIHSTFKDNPFCPEESKRKNLSYQPVSRCRIVESKKLTEDLAHVYDCVTNPMGFDSREVRELARCQINEYKKSASDYNWSVYGLGEEAEQPNRIFKWTEIAPHEYNAIDAKIYTYCDWGVVDPWAIGDVKYYDGALYVKEHNYLSENELRAKLNGTDKAVVGGPEEEGLVIWMFNKLGIPTTREIICDSNRPRKILALRAAGFDYAIGPTKKQNSIIDGISALQNLKVYYTSDSPNINNEQKNYSRRKFKDEILEEPEDFNNHHMDGIRYVEIYLEDEGIIKTI